MRGRMLILLAGVLYLISCESTTGPAPVDCNQSDLAVTVSSFEDASGCNTSDGSFVLIASGGEGSYQYKLENGSFQSQPDFGGLTAGNYTVYVMDKIGCERSTQVSIGFGGNISITEIATTETGCGTADGTITVTASGGDDIMYKINDGSYGTSNTFSNLDAGIYIVTVKNSGGCEFSQQVNLVTGIPFATIRDIINTNCTVSNCHSSSGSSLNFTVDSNVVSMAERIKTQTQNGSMPPPSQPDLTAEQINQIACWVDDGANLD